MIEKQLQHVSSLLDDELHPDDAGLIVESLQTHENSGKKLDRYALIGDALRDETIVVYEESFLNKVQRALAEEPIVLAPRYVKKSNDKPYIAVALAASLAFISVVLFNIFPAVDNNTGMQPYAENVEEADTRLAFEEEKNIELQEYLRQHKGASPEDTQTLDTRLVGFEK